MGLGGAVAPRGSQRRQALQKATRPFFAWIRRLETRIMADGTGSLTETRARAEGAKLKASWARHDPADLEEYLVSGYQNPRINAQSILARHFLVRSLFGDRFEDLMHAELEFCVRMNAAIRARAAELGVTMRAYIDAGKRAPVAKVCEVIAPDEDIFEKRWAGALAGLTVPEKAKVLEFACGSANDYRYLDSYGIARYLDFTGVDLNEGNIANARRRFANVDFQVQSILDLPFPDDSFDYVLAFDIFEHLSIDSMETAIGEAMRLARRGMVFAFFNMSDAPEHNVRPRGIYHWNRLSAPKIEELAGKKFRSVEMTHIPTFLKTSYHAESSHNKNAWTLIAQQP